MRGGKYKALGLLWQEGCSKCVLAGGDDGAVEELVIEVGRGWLGWKGGTEGMGSKGRTGGSYTVVCRAKEGADGEVSARATEGCEPMAVVERKGTQDWM